MASLLAFVAADADMTWINLNSYRWKNMRYYRIAACRGRDKDNPSFRGRSGVNFEQKLELGSYHASNTLTSVAKDNYIFITEEQPIMCYIL